MSDKLTAKRKREMQEAGVKFGCFDNVDNGHEEQPLDDCCIDYGDRGECLQGVRRSTREDCPYWREVEKKDTEK